MPGRKRSQDQPCLHVIIVVRGGMAEVLFKPLGVSLSIYDYDWEAAEPNDPHLSETRTAVYVCTRNAVLPKPSWSSKYWPGDPKGSARPLLTIVEVPEVRPDRLLFLRGSGRIRRSHLYRL